MWHITTLTELYASQPLPASDSHNPILERPLKVYHSLRWERCVHRGSFWARVYTETVGKLFDTGRIEDNLDDPIWDKEDGEEACGGFLLVFSFPHKQVRRRAAVIFLRFPFVTIWPRYLVHRKHREGRLTCQPLNPAGIPVGSSWVIYEYWIFLKN